MSRRADAAAAALVGVVALVVYGLTLYRTLPGGDSGELVGAVASGGVIHPPGYPLYSILGGVFLHVPFGGLAFRLNLFSAVCDAAAAAILTKAVTRGTGSVAAGVVAGAFFAFSPGVWRYAIAAEVFALNNLAVASLLLCAVLYDASKDRLYAYLGAFTLGLGLANHQTVLFTGVPVVVWALLSGRSDLHRLPVLGRLVLAGAAGLLPYLYLPVLAAHHAFVSWGAANTWNGFWTHVLRREYGTFRLAPEGVGADVPASAIVAAWWRHTRDQTGLAGLALEAAGAIASARDAWQRPRRLGLVLLVPPFFAVFVMAALGNLPVSSDLMVEILARFWQQPDLYLAALAGVGFASVAASAPRRLRASEPFTTATLVLAGVLSLRQAGLHYPSLDRHTSALVERYGAEMLRATAPGALLVSKGDLITNSIRYLQVAEDARRDVRVVDQELLATEWGRALFARRYPEVVFPGPRLSLDPARGFSLKAFFDANAGVPLVLCGGEAPGDHSADSTYGLWPDGFCEEVLSGGSPVSIDDWLARSEAGLPRLDFGAESHPKGSWEDVVWSDYWEVRQGRAAHLMTVAGSNPARRKYLPVAAEILGRIVRENPDVPGHVYKNLAIAIGRAGIATPDDRARARRAWEGYLRTAPPDDPEAAGIRAEVERLAR